MGAVISSETDINSNELLKKLVGEKPISDNDPLWNQMFSFNMNLMDEINSKIFLWQNANALIIIRYVCNFLVQRLSEKEFINYFESTLVETPTDSIKDETVEYENMAEEFLVHLVNILCKVPVNDFTIGIHMEAIRCIIVLLSSQLYQDTVSENCIFLRYLVKQDSKAAELVHALLANFLKHNSESIHCYKENKPESIVISLASSMWSAFRLTVLNDSNDDSLSTKNHEFPPQTLGLLSCALLMHIAGYPVINKKPNPFNEKLALFQNAQEVSSMVNLEASFKLDFTALYDRICGTVEQPFSMLLLYMLLHKNSGFRNFVLSRINLENLVVPVVKVLNDRVSSTSFRANSHHTYLALIVVLILSEDDFFCKIIHETMLKNIEWYQPDRPIPEISLGGLIILVFTKTIHMNTVKTRDRYLHTNCLAALANMSSCFKNLNAMVCQKLIGLLETMTKRHAKLIQTMRVNAEASEETDEIDDLSSTNLHHDITALEEGIRTVLEMINSCLCNNLRNNAHLIYTILYNRELFEHFHNHPMFQDLVWNIYLVINHFSGRIETVKSSSVDVVLDTIAKAAIIWPSDRLKKFPELKFKYVEDENTVEFFVPYVWRLIDRNSGIYWNPNLIHLFNPDAI
uniref:Dymeclin n=1 Tax=Acrobeloides nanus TaxID=290746 RepID=A0A914DUU8_9BILA